MTTVATEPRRRVHLAWLVGLSASIYAVNLAAVSAVQAQGDRQLADQQAPSQNALELLRIHDAQLAQEIDHAAATLKAGASTYAQAGDTLISLEERLTGLGKSAAFPALPAVPSVGGGSATVPAVHTTTGASGTKP